MVPFNNENFSATMLKKGPKCPKLSCLRHTKTVRTSMKCHGPCGNIMSLECFSKNARSHEKPVSAIYVLKISFCSVQ